MDAKQLKRYINNVLQQELKAKYSTNSATYQLLMTAAAESNCGEFLYQINGPARGLFQIEPNTEKLTWKWCLENDEYLLNALIRVIDGNLFGGTDLSGNIKYQIILARANYYAWPHPLPKIDYPITDDNIRDMAVYWKKYWNTVEGAGRVEEAIDKYMRFVGKDV